MIAFTEKGYRDLPAEIKRLLVWIKASPCWEAFIFLEPIKNCVPQEKGTQRFVIIFVNLINKRIHYDSRAPKGF